MSVKNRTDKEWQEIAELRELFWKRKEQFWKGQYQDLEKQHAELKNKYHVEITRHLQILATPTVQACGQIHSKDLVLVGWDDEFCVHYQMSTNYYFAYRDGKDIGGGNTLQAARETCKDEKWGEDE